MILAGLAFTLMTWAVKIARTEMSTFEVVWWRSAISAPLSLVLAWRVGLTLHRKDVFTLRAAFGFLAMLGFYTAPKGLPLADVSLLHKLQPILVGLLAPIVLGRDERGGAALWLVVLAGISGCAIMLAPDLQGGNVYGLYAAGGAVFSAGAHLAVRKLGASDDPRVIVFWFMTASFAMCSIAVPLTTGKLIPVPSLSLVPWLVAVGVLATAGQMLMTLAYKCDRAPVVAAAAYTAPVFAVAIDAVAFGVLPDHNAILGGGIIVGAGLVLLVPRWRLAG